MLKVKARDAVPKSVARTSPSCAMGSGLERGRLRGGAVRRALQGLASDMCAALGSRLTDQMLSARLNIDG